MSEQVLADRYRVVRKLGEGGMAEVFLVHDPLADRPVALKLLKAGDSGRDYFMHEFRVLARLDHPNLIEVYDFGTTEADGGDPDAAQSYYTCEYLSGQNLFDATDGLDFDGLFDITRQVLESLGYIHDRGLVHYDIKPENIYVQTEASTSPGKRDEYRVKLVDFGLTGAATTTRGQKIKGTIHYVAPEVAKSLPADRRADLYSLGITLYYVVTRKLPYDGGSAVSILRKHIDRIPAPPASVRADVPEAWASFILQLIEKEPGARYTGAPEALEDLARRLGKPYEPRPSAGHEEGRIALSPSFVGRTAELEQLAGALPSREKTSPGVFWIDGEEGLGKSRLVHALKVRAQLLGVPFLDSVCLKEGQRPFARIVRLALTLPEVRPLADAVASEIETLFPGVAGGAVTPAPVGNPEDLQLILDRVAEFLVQAARLRPFVLVLEDVRRANEITVALLGILLRSFTGRRGREPNMLVVLTDRPEGESGEVLALTEDIPEEIAGEIVEDLSEIRRLLATRGLVTSMPLGRLSLEETSQMVASMLALSETEPAAYRKIHEATGGNPLFIEELVRSLVEDGLLTLRRTPPEDLANIEPPRSLAELLGQRLARMPEDARAVLVAMSILVAPSDLRLLSLTAKRPAEDTLDALDLLIRRQMVYRVDDPEGGAPTYRLAHSQVQRSVLKSVSRRAQEATHRRALAALEAEFPEGPRRDQVLDRLARHAHKCGDSAAALNYATAAGVRAQSLGNPQQAIDLLDRSLELLRWEALELADGDRREREVLILTRLSEVLSTVGRYKDAARALEELLALGDDALEGGATVWARRRLGDLALRRGNSAEARRWLQDALVAAGDAPSPALRAERARALEVMSRVALWRGDYLQVIALASETVQILTSIGREAGSLWAENILCTSEYYRGQTRRAAQHLHRCLRLAQEDGTARTRVLDRLALVGEDRRLLDDALNRFDGSEPLRRPAGDAYGLVLSSTHVATYVDMCAGTDQSLRFYEASVDAYERLGDAQQTALAHNNLGVYRRHAGQFAAALSAFEASLAIHEGSGDRHGGAVALINMVLLLLVLGDVEGAHSRSKRALTIAREIGITWLTGHCHRALGRVLALQGSLGEAERELQRAAGVFRMIGNSRSLSDLLLDRAEILGEAGATEKAQAMLAKSSGEGEDEKASDYLFRSRLLEGRLLLPTDPKRAVDHFERARREAGSAGVCEQELAAHRALASAYTRLETLRLAQEHLDAAHALESRLLDGVDAKLRELFDRTAASTESRATSRRLVERSLED